MLNQFSRTELLMGREAIEKLNRSRVAVFGIGGVGGYVVEGLIRSGIGAIDLIDNDTVSLTNLNRQIIATYDTIGRNKVDVAKERISSIAPDCDVKTYTTFFLPETQQEFDFREYDYVVDAIDTVAGKLAIIEKAKREGVPVISCMGTGNKLQPSMLQVADIHKTSVCPMARVIRRECRIRGIRSLKVVYSTEDPIRPMPSEESSAQRRVIPGSTSFVPSAAGLIIAGEVVGDLTMEERARFSSERRGSEA